MKTNRLVIGTIGALLIAFGAGHFFHEYQPRGRESDEPIAGYTYIEGPTLAELPRSAFARGEGETDVNYAARMTMLVHHSTYHCDAGDHQLSLPGLIVQSAMRLVGRDPQFYQGLVRKRTLRCGLCSERSIALSKILSDHGLDSYAQGLNGHVASKFTVNGIDYLADPDYGVGPFPYASTEAELRQIYSASSIPDLTDLVLPIIADRTDDYVYFERSYLDGLKALRSIFYRSSAVLAAVAAALGCALVTLALLAMYLRPKTG